MKANAKLISILASIALLWPLPTFAQDVFIVKDAVLKLHESREIPSKVAGIIQQSHIREGSMLEAGQLVMEVDARQANLDVQKLTNEQAIAAQEATSTVELEFMKKSIGVAKAELVRALESNRRLPGAVPKSEVDQLALVAERAVAEKNKAVFDMQMKQIHATIRGIDLNIGKQQLKDHRIQSPINGTVVEIYKKAGEWVNASDPIAKVVQLNQLRAEVKIPASIALSQLVGTNAVFSPALDVLKGKTFEGTVTHVRPEANPVSRQIKVWIVINNQDRKLVPGLVGDVKLLRRKSEHQQFGVTSAK